MRAWEQTSAAWLDHSGAWQPSARDATAQAAAAVLGLRAQAALTRGDVPAGTGTPAMALRAGAATATAGVTARARAASLELGRGPVTVTVDVAADIVAGRMVLAVHPVADRHAGWREWDAGCSVPAMSLFRDSRPATLAHVRSCL